MVKIGENRRKYDCSEPKNELLPCPFCGWEAKENYRDNWSGEVCVGCSNHNCNARPCCSHQSPAIPNEDGITSNWDWELNKREAIRKWNTRSHKLLKKEEQEKNK